MKHEPRDPSLVIGAILLGAILLAATLLGAGVLRAQDLPSRGAFVLVQRGDTVQIERFTSDDRSMSIDLAIKNRGRMVYAITRGPNFTIPRLSLTFYLPSANPDAPAAQTAEIRIVGDSAIADIVAAGRSVTQRFKTARDVIMSVPSFAAFELVVRRAQAAGGTARVPIFNTSGGTTTEVAVEPIGADSLRATVGTQEYRLAVDRAGRILGGSIPAQGVVIGRVSAEAAATIALGKPDYAAPADAPYRSEEVTLQGPAGITLGGTLTLPKGAAGRVPAIVTITGSGQQDRDEYLPVAGGFRPFRQIADTLGRRGIAVLRLDDRMIGTSSGAAGTSADYADDIRAALAWLRTRHEIDASRLGVLGHSEGGLIGPIVAAAEPALKAIVMLAGPSDGIVDVIRYQQRYAIDRDTSIAAAKRDSAYRTAALALDSLVATSPWHRYLATYDALATARRVKAPALILQGETDRQVTAEQAGKLAAAMRAGGNRDVTVRVFPQLNHLFILDPDGSPAGYAKLPTNKMSSEVLGVIADWLALKLGAKTSG